MRKIFAFLLFITISIGLTPRAYAAAGIFASGGGSKTVGQAFTVTVTASGADFDSLQGTISVSGPVTVTSFSAGSATWLPGKSPANGSQFVGITSATSSLTVATIKLKGTSAGSGSVSLSGVKLARNGNIVGTGAGAAAFTIEKAPELPGSVEVSSSTHPDQNAAYEATSATINWNKPKNAIAFSYLIDQAADTTPPQKATGSDTAATYNDLAIGTYYFHIRAQSNDGWGSTTHFKLTVKEPDPKIDETLPKPSEINVSKTDPFTNNINDGTVTGLKITGTTEPNFTANITLLPAITLPEGKSLNIVADESGHFSFIIDFPIPAGTYKISVQGQNNKILTPISDEVRFAISQFQGGSVAILTADDEHEPPVVAPAQIKWYEKYNQRTLIYTVIALSGLIVILIAYTLFITIKYRRLIQPQSIKKVLR